MPWSSNATFLAELALEGTTTLAVYKPERGERPLWDFPRGLYKRELAAWHLSEAFGWGLVPLTVRRDGPYGEGSFQLFIPADFEQHYFTLRENPAHHGRLQRICLFDLVANNADRKSGHCLLGPDGGIYGVDNGLCFHVEPKLRTVLWGWAGRLLTDEERWSLGGLHDTLDRELGAQLGSLLTVEEVEATRTRVDGLLRAGRFPGPGAGRMPIPWPPF